ncbi:MAG: 4Fe-4S binding protein [bacterium]
MARIGVFVCHCGSNIAAHVDVQKVAEEMGGERNVVFSTDYKYMCSDPGQKIIRDAIREHKLDRVVVAACSPSLHEKTFRRTLEDAGINPYLLEIANIREQCSWVHQNQRDVATRKALDLVRRGIAKARRLEPLMRESIPLTKRALVIGGGIAGIQSAIDIAMGGYEVILVEREPSIGGRMAQFDKTFPTLDCASCILTPKMVDVSHNENVKIYTYSEVESVEGYVGNFKVRIRKKARSVDENLCTGCGVCWIKCPVKKIESEFDQGLGFRTAIYTPFPQAVPNVPVIDKENCIYYIKGKCKVCEKFCEAGAIRFDQEDEIIEEKVGAIVVATGFTTFDHSVYGEYGHGKFKDVITGIQFERMLNSSGPTGGHIRRPSDGKEPKVVVFIQCVGSRDEKKGVPYCSRLCCMYTAKHTILLKEHVPDSQAYVFYIDIRAAGKNYEEFVKRAQTDYGAIYLRGRVSKIYERGDKLIVKGADTIAGRQVEIEADMVVLATALVARRDAQGVARMLGVQLDENNFFTELHPKLAPVENVTAGIYLTGSCQAPKDIPDTVATASGAASKVLVLFSQERLLADPMVSQVDVSRCSGCRTCYNICPFSAIQMVELRERNGEVREVAEVIESICKGCGTCVAGCRSAAINLKGFTNEEIFDEIDALVAI